MHTSTENMVNKEKILDAINLINPTNPKNYLNLVALWHLKCPREGLLHLGMITFHSGLRS
jgi:hypothetical protein